MTTYELAKTMKDTDLARLERAGIVSRNIRRYVYIYEQVQIEIKNGHSKRDAYMLVGERVFTCDENVKKIVQKMEKEVR